MKSFKYVKGELLLENIWKRYSCFTDNLNYINDIAKSIYKWQFYQTEVRYVLERYDKY